MDFLKAAKEKAQKAALALQGLSPLEIVALEATNDDKWGPHGSQMAELAKGTSNGEQRGLIMALLWRRLAEEKPELWRHVYKTLAIFDYFIANGDISVVEELRDNLHKLKSLSTFEYKDPEGKDQGINVRHKSTLLVQLLNDNAKIQETREKALANRNKYSGVSSDDVRMGSSKSINAMSAEEDPNEFSIGNKNASSESFNNQETSTGSKFRVQLKDAPPLSGKLQMALGTVPAPTAAPVSPPAPVYAAPPPPLMDLLGGDPAPAPAPAPAFAAFGQPAAAAPAFAAFGQPPPAPAGFGAFGQAAPAFPAAFPGGPAPAAPSPFAANFGNAPGPAAAPAASGFGDFGAFSAAPSPAAAPAGPVDPFAFQNAPAAMGARPGGMGMGAPMPGGLGAKGQGGLGAPPASSSAAANKGLSLEDSLMANLAGLSMNPSKPAQPGGQPKLGGW